MRLRFNNEMLVLLQLMRHLLGTHLGHNGVLTMCCILEDRLDYKQEWSWGGGGGFRGGGFLNVIFIGQDLVKWLYCGRHMEFKKKWDFHMISIK